MINLSYVALGPVPPRVDARVKAGLLDLGDYAVEAGWSPRRAAARLGVDDARLGRWQARRALAALAIAQQFALPAHSHRPGLDRDPVRPCQGRVAAPGKDP